MTRVNNVPRGSWNQPHEREHLCTHVIGNGPSREGDLSEMCAMIHGLQRAVLKQAAARAYPDRYRLLGGVIPPRSAAEHTKEDEA